MKEHYDVTVIGAGAAGMTAAVFAGRKGARVCVIEHRQEPGKKILQTGNGRCNLTHEKVSGSDYNLVQIGNKNKAKEDFIQKALSSFGVDRTTEFFRSVGIFTRNRNGYIYPYSATALSVRNALWDELKRLGVCMLTDTEVERACNAPRYDHTAKNSLPYRFKLLVRSAKNPDDNLKEASRTVYSENLILAAGLCAAPKAGSDGSGIRLAKELGLKVNTVLPALVKLKCAGDICKTASGVRHSCKVELSVNGRPAAGDTGELQFTDDGISGIPVFNVSRYGAIALSNKLSVNVKLDLLPGISEEECLGFVEANIEVMKDRKLAAFLGGLLPGKLLAAVARTLGISPDRRVRETDGERLRKLVLSCKAWELEVKDVYGFDQAQVCTGGVDISQIDPLTMQIYGAPGLYVAGELADIDGPCGGYNLQWAWTSGALAGSSAAD